MGDLVGLADSADSAETDSKEESGSNSEAVLGVVSNSGPKFKGLN